MRDGWRIELTQTITEKVDMAVTREKVDLLNSLQTMIDSKLSSKIFSKYRIPNLTGLKRVCFSKDNENRYKHKARVLSKLKKANEHLNSTPINEENVKSAKSSITEGIELVKN